MEAIISSFILIIFIILAGNLFMVYRRYKNNFPKKMGRIAREEQEAAIIRDREVYRRIGLEQDELSRRVELRSRTWELYYLVRKHGALIDQGLPIPIPEKPIREPDPAPEPFLLIPMPDTGEKDPNKREHGLWRSG